LRRFVIIILEPEKSWYLGLVLSLNHKFLLNRLNKTLL
jgi:hypothetical protein